MSTAKSGDKVRLHYTGKLDDGSVFDSSNGQAPLEFVVGSGQVIPGLDKEIPGMQVGETKTVKVPCDEAYGQHDPSARQSVPREAIPADIPLTPGAQLQAQAEGNQIIAVTVVSADETEVILDANHPLAGKDLTFEIELVELV